MTVEKTISPKQTVITVLQNRLQQFTVCPVFQFVSQNLAQLLIHMMCLYGAVWPANTAPWGWRPLTYTCVGASSAVGLIFFVKRAKRTDSNSIAMRVKINSWAGTCLSWICNNWFFWSLWSRGNKLCSLHWHIVNLLTKHYITIHLESCLWTHGKCKSSIYPPFRLLSLPTTARNIWLFSC